MLYIGSVPMGGLAAPESFPLGGEQKIPYKQLPGGSIVYQPRGYFPTINQNWEGTFVGPDADQHVNKLNEMVLAGTSVLVTFHTFSFYCFVTKFKWLWVRENWIDFEIELLKDMTPRSIVTAKGKKDPIATVIKAAQIIKKQEAAQTTKKPVVHVVVKGDTLRKIAQRYYKNPEKYKEIFNANKKVIGKDPNKIKVGMRLVIP